MADAGFTPRRINALAQAFEAFDITKDRMLDHDEVAGILHEMGMTASDQDVQEVLKQLDKNKDERIVKGEFMQASPHTLMRLGLTNGSGYYRTAPPPPPEPVEAAPAPVQSAAAPDLQSILQRLCACLERKDGSLREAFRRLDDDHSGFVSRHEFSIICRVFNFEVSAAEKELLFQSFDVNYDGLVAYTEFCTAMEDVLARHGNGQKAPGPVRRPPKRYLPPKSLSSLQGNVVTQELLQCIKQKIMEHWPTLNEAFLTMDTDRKGYVTAQEFAVFLHYHTIPVDWPELQGLVRAFDVNNDGRVSYPEFCRTLDAMEAPEAPTPVWEVERRAIRSRYKLNEAVPWKSVKAPAGVDPRAFEIPRIIRLLREKTKGATVRQKFLELDRDSNGWISRQEFEEFFTDMHLRMDPELLILLMDHYDTDHDGKIKYSELAEALS
uniref:EF-hand domain-containing protein n=1 Tax=Eutreptiella gymnastica TaxID=73025 RepID=A0A7S4FZP8_9EUGL